MKHILLALFTFIFLAHANFANAVPEKIRVVNSNVWAPYSFTGEDGKPKGILVELWQEFAKHNNVEVEFIQLGWKETLDSIKYGNADVHAGLFESSERKQYMDFCGELDLPLNTRLFISNKLGIKSLNNLGRIKVGVTDHGYVQSFMQRHYPWVELIPYTKGVECLEAAAKGEIMAFATDYPAAMYHLHRLGAHDDFYIADTLYTKNISPAVRKGNDELKQFVVQGLKKIPEDEVNRITQKWIQSVTLTPDWLTPLLSIGTAVLLGCFCLFYIFMLRKQVDSRTRELQHLSQTDMLTGLYNRRKIDELFDEEFNRFERYSRNFCIILLDIDNFKNINDTYGHCVGDEILIAFSSLILSSTRKTEKFGRWGGEEFLIICPETTGKEGVQIAEKLRSLIESTKFKTVGRCTASFGVTQSRLGDAKIDIFSRCDIALYQSKENGRNNVTEG